MRVIIEPDYENLSRWAAEYVAAKINAAKPTPEKPFKLGCPTGSSPLGLYKHLIEMYKAVYALMESGKVLSASVVKEGGAAASVCKACFGNGFGFSFTKELTNTELFAPLSGSLILELADGACRLEAALFEIDDKNGKCLNAESMRIE